MLETCWRVVGELVASCPTLVGHLENLKPLYYIYLMKILIIEDESSLAQSIGAYLSDKNYTCEFARSFGEAIDKIDNFDYDCILLDLMLPGGDGLKILEEIKAQNKLDGVIIISARNS